VSVKSIAGVVLACVACIRAFAQPEQADKLLAHGKQVISEQGARAALPDIEQALKFYEQAKNRAGEAMALGYLGYAYREMGDYPKAIQYLQQSLGRKRRLGDRKEQGKTLVNLGLTYWDQGNYRQAIAHSTEALGIARSIGDRQIEGAALNNLGLCYDEVGEFRRSLDFYQQALAIHRSTGFTRGEADALGNLGGRYLLLGRYREALPYYQEALAIDERENLKPSMCQDLGNLGLCFAGLGRLPESLASFDRAMALARETGQRKEESDWHKGKGRTLLRSGKYDAALSEYRLSTQVYEQAGLQRELVEALQDLGELHVLLGDSSSAENEFQRALEISRKIGHPRGANNSLVALAGIEWRRKRYPQAASLYQEALSRARQSGDQEQAGNSLTQLALTDRDLGRTGEAIRLGLEALDIARRTGAKALESEALYSLAEAERTAGRAAAALDHYTTGDKVAQLLGDPDLAWRYGYGEGQVLEALDRAEDAVKAYERAATVIESARAELREERFRAGYLEDKYQVYVSLVRLLLQLGRTAQAFHYSERLRAQSYASLLNNTRPKARTDAERELRERILQLQRSIDEENAKSPSDRRAAKVDSYSAELAQAERAYQNLLDDLRSSDPEYALARSLTTPSPEDLQRRLGADAAIIEYVAAEDTLAIFFITAHRLQATVVPAQRSDLASKVELLRDLVNREGANDWQRPAFSLRRALIDPLEKAGWLRGITRLYVVPHAALHYLPFGLLPTGVESGARTLVEDYAIAYLPAAAALRRRADREAPSTLLAAAPEVAKLRYAKEEARAVSEFFPRQNEVLIGTDATETAFKRDASRYRVIHIATHGYLNRLNPLFSSLALQADPANDGRLEVHEILDLRLRSQLVTLSACDTALGSGYFAEVPAGEEFVGLTRAFLYAGSPAVLATLWQVNDRSTLDFMRSFYQQREARGAAIALAEAQRKMIHSGGRYSHPYFWAPFVLVGPSSK
jgi:CHAT domain-containing protein/tetratricopeptide (TPR) repeat protein